MYRNNSGKICSVENTSYFHYEKGNNPEENASRRNNINSNLLLGCLRNEMFILASICATSQSRMKCI